MKLIKLFFIVSVLLIAGNISAQNLPQIQASPHSKVMQEVGFSEITIDYHRPAVKGREVWGKLVPYGMTNLGFGTAKESPWRAGANENTTISFTDDVKINGNTLKAGTYGLHIIVTEEDWVIIFSKTSTAWGSFFYDPKDDALRVNVKPEKSDFTEWLVYGFENLTNQSADVFLKWENIKVKFEAAFDMDNVVLDRYRKLLVGAQGFNAQNYQQAATYFIAKNINLDEAEQWIDHSIQIQETGSNLLTKAQLLEKKGSKKEAEDLIKKEINIATEAELNTYGYTLMLQYNDIDKALDIFKINVDKHPDSWNVYDSLGEAYGKKGDKENAVKYYSIALQKSPENQKERIEKAIDDLKN
jgi:tetratricopeptide (TPR) repeat protein